MNITLLAFAQARDTFGFSQQSVPCAPEETPRQLLTRVAPGVNLDHLRVALDQEYVPWDAPIGSAQVLAIIPPVSGG